MTISEIVGIVTAIVAVLGLGLSLYNFYVSQRAKHPRLIAKISNGFLTFGPELSETMLILEITNPGEKKVLINSVQIGLGKQFAFFPNGVSGSRRVPFELSPGENAMFWTPLKEFVKTLCELGDRGKLEVKARFTDAVGTRYLSKGLALDVDEWARDTKG